MSSYYTTQRPTPAAPERRPWLARLGLAGFLFFLGKGVLWLIAPALLMHGCAT